MRRLGADLEEKQEPRGALAAECNIVTHEMIRTSLTLAAIEKRSFQRETHEWLGWAESSRPTVVKRMTGIGASASLTVVSPNDGCRCAKRSIKRLTAEVASAPSSAVRRTPANRESRPVAVASGPPVGMDSPQRCGSRNVYVNSRRPGDTQGLEEGDRRLMPGGVEYGAERETNC